MAKNRIITIHNQDPNNLHYSVKESLKPEHVDKMIDNIATSGVDVALINSNAEVANHPSSVFGTYEDMFDGEPAKLAPAGIPQSYWDIFANDCRQYLSLKSHGCDYLKRALQRCRIQNLRPGITVRMNDMHGCQWENAPSHSPFFREHPECRIMVENNSLGLDYACETVRRRMLDYISELSNNYDFDFLELDWIRFATHFYPGEGFKSKNLITDFMAEARNILKDVTIIARVHQNPAAALDGGLDIATWAKSGLVDIIAPCSFFSLRFDVPVAEYRRLTEDRVKIFGCFDDTDQTEKSMLEQPRLSRGAIAAVLASGAQGVEFFNQFFGADENDPKIKLRSELLSKMHQSMNFHGLTKEFRVEETPFHWEKTTDLPWQLPVDISRDNPQSFSCLMAKLEKNTSAKIEISYDASSKEAGKLQLAVNKHFIENTKLIKPSIDKIIFSVPGCCFKTGKNQLLITYTAKCPATIKSIRIKSQ